MDNHLRLTLSGDGPLFLAEDSVRRSPSHRRVGNLYYDRDFAQRLVRHMPLTGGRLQSSLNSVQLEQQLAGNCLGHLMPTHATSMFPVAADAFASPDLIQWKGALCSQMVKRDQLEVLSGDATMKVTLGLAGQLRRRDGGGPAKLGSGGGAWTPAETHAVVYSVCTALGGTLGLQPQPGESAEDVTRALCEVVRPEDGHRLRWLVVDNASVALATTVRGSFPCLQGLAMDTVHLAMKYESVHGRKRTAGSSLLRRMLRKFNL